MQIAHKIKLKPNNKQKTYLLKACGTSSFAWNWALAEWDKQYKEGKRPTGMGLKKEFNAIKKIEFPWTKEVTKYAGQQPFLDLQEAYNRFWKKITQKPKFKKKGNCRDSFYMGGDHLRITGKKIWIPNLGFVRMRENPRFYTTSKFSKCETNKFIGVDLSINRMVTLSNKLSF